MSFVAAFVRHPRSLRLRHWLFQVHLWAGVILALYLILIGITGSILVFREEITAAWFAPLTRPVADASATVGVAEVASAVRTLHPQARITQIQTPTRYCASFRAYTDGPEPRVLFVDSATAEVTGGYNRERFWISWLQDLHFHLLAGSIGLQWNGAGGVALVILCLTGLVVWWPGVSGWRSALVLHKRSSWKRFNWDLHGVSGIWTLAFTLMWGVTGAYFAWPLVFAGTINAVSPITNARPPRVRIVPPPAGTPALGLSELVRRAEAVDPGRRLAGVQFPPGPEAPVVVVLAREETWNLRAADYIYLDPYRGAHRATWQRGVHRTPGDVAFFLLGPLHFGVYWGTTVKILWAIAGLSLPLLSITGLWMYWNRALSRYWRRLRA